MHTKIATINEEQRKQYERIDLKNSKRLARRYAALLDLKAFDRPITLLDVGGGSGYFTKAMCQHLQKRGHSVTAYVLDTMPYPNWKEASDYPVIFQKGSAEYVDTYFKEQKFDLIFCNKVFHHFVTGSYAETLRMLETCMKKLKNSLSKNGQLCILDLFYDGLIIDGFPSWMIYQCTSQKNELLIKIFKKFGAKSAGNGVCFQSEKMWRRLIADCGFDIVAFEKGSVFPMKKLKQLIFLTHKPVEDCIFVCSSAMHR